MAQKGHMHEDDIFIVNQSGWGLGRNVYPKHTLYKVRKTIEGTTPITIVSPVAGKKKSFEKRRQSLKESQRKKLPRRKQLKKVEKRRRQLLGKRRPHTFASMLKSF